MNLRIPHWQVWDPLWNKEPAWTEQEYPDATLRYMKEAGCLVTSIAIVLRLYGIEPEINPDRFNPWLLNEKLKKICAFLPDADLNCSYIHNLYPLHFIGTMDYSRAMLKKCMDNGEICLVKVDGVHDKYHYVVPFAVDDDDVRIIDSGWDYPRLSNFDHVYSIYRFVNEEHMTLPEIHREKVIRTAVSFRGVQESCYETDDVVFNEHFYGGPVCGPDDSWCISFLWNVFRMCGCSGSFYNRSTVTECMSLYHWGKENNLLCKPDRGRRGDIILMDLKNIGAPTHAGLILEKPDTNYYLTIEGNTRNASEHKSCRRVMVKPRPVRGTFGVIRPDYGIL